MELSAKDLERFYNLYCQTLLFATASIDDAEDEVEFIKTQQWHTIPYKSIQALWGGSELINRFVEENPYNLSKDDINIVHNWMYGLIGTAAVIDDANHGIVFATENHTLKVANDRQLLSIFSVELPNALSVELLPFEDVILCTPHLEIASVSLTKNELIEHAEKALLRNDPISTSLELIEEMKSYGEVVMERDFAQIDAFFDALMGMDEKNPEDEESWFEFLDRNS